jgi:hypothetical protein
MYQFSAPRTQVPYLGYHFLRYDMLSEVIDNLVAFVLLGLANLLALSLGKLGPDLWNWSCLLPIRVQVPAATWSDKILFSKGLAYAAITELHSTEQDKMKQKQSCRADRYGSRPRPGCLV